MSGSASFQIVGKTIFDYFLFADHPPSGGALLFAT